MSPSSNKIYVDIPSLFDLRHSALYQILGEQASLEIVTSPPYNLRETDTFKEVDMALFDAYIQTDDLRILEHAPLTYIQTVLSSKIANAERRSVLLADQSHPELILNTYPFKLNEQQTNLMQNALFISTGKACAVTLIYEHPKKLSPHWLKSSGFSVCVMYDFHGWLQHHATACNNADLKDVIMYFAPICKTLPTKDELRTIAKVGFKDVFSYTEYIFAGKVQLNFLPIFMFSSIAIASAFLEVHGEELKPPPPKDRQDSV